MIVIHPRWCDRAGIGDIVRHFEVRGFDVSNVVGSRFFSVKPKPIVPPGYVKQEGFRSINFFSWPK